MESGNRNPPVLPSPPGSIGITAAMLPLPAREVATLRGHQGPVLTVRFNRNGSYCMTGGQDRTVRLWNPHKGLAIKTYTGHGREVLDVCISEDNSKFASVGGDILAFYWDVGSGRVIRKFRGHTQRINTVRFNEECSVVVTGSYDATVRIFDCRSNMLDAIQVLEEHRDSISSLVVKNGMIITGSVDGAVRVFDVRKGTLTIDTIHHPITSVSLTHDENCILVSCLDSTMRLLDRTNGDLLNEFSGHTNSTLKCENDLTNTDSHVMSGSEDGRVCFWDLVEANLVHSLQGHTGAVCGVQNHPDEVCVVSCGVDGTTRVWK